MSACIYRLILHEGHCPCVHETECPLELEIPGNLDDLSKARQFVREFCSQNAEGPLDPVTDSQNDMGKGTVCVIKRRQSMSDAPRKEGGAG
jgi:ribosomal protein RSM22 (predicted rRNA methylase)